MSPEDDARRDLLGHDSPQGPLNERFGEASLPARTVGLTLSELALLVECQKLQWSDAAWFLGELGISLSPSDESALREWVVVGPAHPDEVEPLSRWDLARVSGETGAAIGLMREGTPLGIAYGATMELSAGAWAGLALRLSRLHGQEISLSLVPARGLSSGERGALMGEVLRTLGVNFESSMWSSGERLVGEADALGLDSAVVVHTSREEPAPGTITCIECAETTLTDLQSVVQRIASLRTGLASPRPEAKAMPSLESVWAWLRGEDAPVPSDNLLTTISRALGASAMVNEVSGTEGERRWFALRLAPLPRCEVSVLACSGSDGREPSIVIVPARAAAGEDRDRLMAHILGILGLPPGIQHGSEPVTVFEGSPVLGSGPISLHRQGPAEAA